MAIVVAPKDVDQMLLFAEEENLEAVAVAEVTKEPRLVMQWRGSVGGFPFCTSAPHV